MIHYCISRWIGKALALSFSPSAVSERKVNIFLTYKFPRPRSKMMMTTLDLLGEFSDSTVLNVGREHTHTNTSSTYSRLRLDSAEKRMA